MKYVKYKIKVRRPHVKPHDTRKVIQNRDGHRMSLRDAVVGGCYKRYIKQSGSLITVSLFVIDSWYRKPVDYDVCRMTEHHIKFKGDDAEEAAMVKKSFNDMYMSGASLEDLLTMMQYYQL